ncbi:MAG: ferredoxin family protein [Proteobacteria bacterium]|nr:ferredoxin family protein [Pseudomonadota bacterium]
MSYVITQACIGAKEKACLDVCPVDCIHGKDNDEQMYVNPDECIDCGACMPACPVDAFYPEDEVPADQEKFIAKNRAYFSKAK